MTHKIRLLVFTTLIVSGFRSAGQTMDKNQLSSAYVHWDSFFDSVANYADKDNLKALCFGDSALTLAVQLGDSLRIVKSYRFKGQMLRRLDKTNEAILEFQKALVISRRNHLTDETGFALNGLALAYTFQANYDKALQLYFECLVIREKEGNSERICTTLNNIGLLYYKLGNYEKALEYYSATLNRVEVVSFKDHLLVNIGLCYNYLSKFDTAIQFIKKGLEMCGSKCDDGIIIDGELGLGIAHFSLRRYKLAETHFQNSYRLAKENDNKRFQIENLIYLGKIRNNQKLPWAAKCLLSEAEMIATKTQYRELRSNIYKQLAESFNLTEEYREATLYQRKYISLGDSIHNEQSLKNLMRIHAEYEELDNRTKIASQQQILDLKEDAIVQQEYLNILIGIIAILFVCLAAILFRLNRDKQRVNVLLDQKVKDRTLALEVSINGLRRVQEEEADLVRKTSAELRSSIATLEGLREVAQLDPGTPEVYRRYFEEFGQSSSRLSNLVRRLQLIATGRNQQH